MKATITLSSFLLLAAATGANAALPLSSIKRVTSIPVLPSKFIVEVDSSANVPTTGGKKRSVHETLYDALNKRGIDYTVGTEFKDPLFYGSVVTLSVRTTRISHFYVLLITVTVEPDRRSPPPICTRRRRRPTRYRIPATQSSPRTPNYCTNRSQDPSGYRKHTHHDWGG